jgi:hypothetical protein
VRVHFELPPHLSHTMSLSRCAVVLLAILALALALQPAPVSAAFPTPPPGLNKVYFRIYILSISNIDGAGQAFAMDFFLMMMWAAPNPASTGLSCQDPNNCDFLSADDANALYWQPLLEFINSAAAIETELTQPFSFATQNFNPFNLTTQLPPGYLYIVNDQRYQGTFKADLRMNAFPYDIQHLPVQMQSGWTSDRVQFIYPGADKLDVVSFTTSDQATNLGWDFKPPAVISVADVTYAYNDKTFQRFTYTTTWSRNPEYYLTKIVAGMMLGVCMSIWNFSLQVDISDRMMGTLQVFTGLISFLFVASGDTPKLPYQTRLDVFMVFSFFIVGFIMFLHGILYYFREQGFTGKKEKKLEVLERRKRKEFLQNRRGISAFASAARRVGNPKTAPAPAGDPFAAAVPASHYINSPMNTIGNVQMAPPYAQSAHHPARFGFARAVAATMPGGIPSPSAGAASSESMHVYPTSDSNPSAIYQHGSHLKGSHEHEHDSDDDTEHAGWEIRLNDCSTFSFTEWFAALACTRKWDAVLVPTLFLLYTVGCAVILGRPHSDGQQY